MFNPHPPLTGFPVVLLVLLFAVELLRVGLGREGLERTSDLLLLTLAIMTPLTFFSGYLGAADANHAFEVAPEVIEKHRVVGRLLMISLVPLILTVFLSKAARIKRQTIVPGLERSYLFFVFLSLILAVYAGKLGGELVFQHGAGVSADPAHSETLEAR